jgi:hypothetical protein
VHFRSKLSAYRGPRILTLALIGALVTCVEHDAPTYSPDASIADPQATAALVSPPITHTPLTAGTNPTNTAVYTTASISPASNTLVTIAVLSQRSYGASAAPAVIGGGMATWVQVATVTFDALGAPLRRMTIYRAMSAAPGSGPITITFAGNQSNAQWIVSQWDGVETSGTNGSGAIVQTASNAADIVNGLGVTLPAFGDAANVAYGVFGVNSSVAAVTPGSGFTEIAEVPSGENTPGSLMAEWAISRQTIDAGWTNLRGAVLGVEIKTAAGGGGGGVSAALSTVTASPTPIVAGSGTSTITVTVVDANSAPVSGATVFLSATGTGNAITQPGAVTGADGVATGTLSSTVAEGKIVSAKANGTTITQTATVTVTPGPVSASQSTVVAAPASIVPISGSSTITVTAKDANGNPISGATVVLAATGMANLTHPADTTNASGVATGTVRGMMEETIAVSATIDGTAIDQTATVQVVVQTAVAISHTLLTFGTNTVNQRVYSTAAIAPAPNRLITVAVMGHNSSSAAPSPTLSGGGMSAWTEVATITFDAVATPHTRLTIFRAMSVSPGSGPLTITFSKSQSHSQWIVSQWDGVDPSGVNGAGAIVQAGSNRGDAVNGLAVTLAPFGNAGNVAYGVFGVRRNVLAVTPGTGFTEIAEQPSGEGTPNDLEAEWATNDNTIDASWANLSGGALGVEIKAGNTGPVVPVVSVDVTPASASIAVGGTVQLTATARNAEGEPLAGHPFTWATDAPTIATVSPAGLVTGVGAGPATITATSEGMSGTASVTVTATTMPVASVEVTPASASVPVGGMVQLTAIPKDAAGQPLTGRVVTWGTNASAVATVSATGLVTGVSQGGPATITATSEGRSGTASVTVTAGGQSALVGEWSALLPAPVILIHVHLMPDGRVLIFGRTGVRVWDPATGVFTDAEGPSLLFCSGHDFLPDGRLLVTGGGTGNGLGYANTNIFVPATASWIVGPRMAQGRWYPTNTTLPNGEVLTVAGQDTSGTAVPIPEIWDGTSWRQLTGASLALSNYPRDFVAPDGRIFVAGSQAQSKFLDVTGLGSWANGPSMNSGSRSYGSAVMYEPGKILYVGGNSSPTNTAEIIDLNQPSPAWTYTGSLAYARWNLNATVLPTGDVLVTSGVSGSRSNPALAVNAAELWNPATGGWTMLPSAAPLLRGYHSTSLLLPDGRVLHGGGGGGGGTVDNYNYEVYSPAYLFRGARPVITGATPATVGYGQNVIVGTPDAASITKVSLIRGGSVTHAFDQGQRLVPLTFSPVSGGLSVTIPASRNVAPPGPYMLFLVNGNGVPSVARIVLLQ